MYRALVQITDQLLFATGRHIHLYAMLLEHLSAEARSTDTGGTEVEKMIMLFT